MEKKFKAVRVGSSDSNYYTELKKAHEEFQKLLDSGYEITAVKKARRPRIHREPIPKRIKVQAGFISIVVEYADWKANGSIGKIIEKYY